MKCIVHWVGEELILFVADCKRNASRYLQACWQRTTQNAFQRGLTPVALFCKQSCICCDALNTKRAELNILLYTQCKLFT